MVQQSLPKLSYPQTTSNISPNSIPNPKIQPKRSLQDVASWAFCRMAQRSALGILRSTWGTVRASCPWQAIFFWLDIFKQKQQNKQKKNSKKQGTNSKTSKKKPSRVQEPKIKWSWKRWVEVFKHKKHQQKQQVGYFCLQIVDVQKNQQRQPDGSGSRSPKFWFLAMKVTAPFLAPSPPSSTFSNNGIVYW